MKIGRLDFGNDGNYLIIISFNFSIKIIRYASNNPFPVLLYRQFAHLGVLSKPGLHSLLPNVFLNKDLTDRIKRFDKVWKKTCKDAKNRYNIASDKDLKLATQKQAEYLASQTGAISGTVHQFGQKSTKNDSG